MHKYVCILTGFCEEETIIELFEYKIEVGGVKLTDDFHVVLVWTVTYN